MKKYIATIVAGVSCALLSTAHADEGFINTYVQAEIGLGVTNYQIQDGRWLQEGMPGGNNDVTRTTPEFSLGLTGPILTRGKWGVDWRADYVNLGRAAASCDCTIDENYDSVKHQYVQRIKDVPSSHFTGSGRSQGFVLGVEAYRWWEGLRWSAEAGAYIHRDNWVEDVNLYGTGNMLHVNTIYWAVAPVAGIGIGNGRFTLAYRHYFMRRNSAAHEYPPLWNDADTLELKVRF